jgi:hypothetical protein
MPREEMPKPRLDIITTKQKQKDDNNTIYYF